MTKKKTWAEVTPDDLLEMVKVGISYTRIGMMFGVTRNTVSGRVLRWKQKGLLPQALPGVGSNQGRGGRAKSMAKKPAEKVSRRTTRALSFQPSVERASPQKPVAPEKIVVPSTPLLPDKEPVSIFKKREFDCAVVVGKDDAGFPLYCGCPCENLQFRMCAAHAKYMLETSAVRQKNRAARLAIADAAATG